MIKTILWDFDGVILDSMKIKGDGFIELFKDYDSIEVKELEKFHYLNGGISRFEKIRYFYREVINKSISEEEIVQLADKFADIISEKIYDKKNLIQETIDFINNYHQTFNFHIVSGAENTELNELCDFFEIKRFFKSIDGSPVKKNILIENILNRFSYSNDEIILIGDSINDYEAAKSNEIKFYGYNNQDLKSYNYIEDFVNFYDILNKEI